MVSSSITFSSVPQQRNKGSRNKVRVPLCASLLLPRIYIGQSRLQCTASACSTVAACSTIFISANIHDWCVRIPCVLQRHTRGSSPLAVKPTSTRWGTRAAVAARHVDRNVWSVVLWAARCVTAPVQRRGFHGCFCYGCRCHLVACLAPLKASPICAVSTASSVPSYARALLSRKSVPPLQVCGALDLARVALAPARYLVLARLPRLSLQAEPRELRFHATARLHKRRAARALRKEVTEPRRRLRQQSEKHEAQAQNTQESHAQYCVTYTAVARLTSASAVKMD